MESEIVNLSNGVENIEGKIVQKSKCCLVIAFKYEDDNVKATYCRKSNKFKLKKFEGFSIV